MKNFLNFMANIGHFMLRVGRKILDFMKCLALFIIRVGKSKKAKPFWAVFTGLMIGYLLASIF